MTHVVFTHDDELKKWSIKVSGVVNQKEAIQAFTAVVLTCKELNTKFLPFSKVQVMIDDEAYTIIPAV